MTDTMENKCEICGEPMPENETMFKYHGYSGPCPKPPLTRPTPPADAMPTDDVAGLAEKYVWSVHGRGASTSVGIQTRQLIRDAYMAGHAEALHPAPVTDAQRENNQILLRNISCAVHAIQADLKADCLKKGEALNVIKSCLNYIEYLSAALSAPVAQVDVGKLKADVIADVHRCPIEETAGQKKHTAYAIGSFWAVRAAEYISCHYHLTPKTQESGE